MTALAESPQPASLSGHRRVRVAMYLAFLAVGLGVLLQGWNTLRLESARAADARAQEYAGEQRVFVQQIGRIAALIAAEPAERARHSQALGEAMSHGAADALALHAMLREQHSRSAEAAARLQHARDAWDAARERLWLRADLLLRQAHRDDAQAAGAALALQAETAPAGEAVQALAATLRGLSAERALELQGDLRSGLAALLALLLALGLAVVEPSARAVRSHAERLVAQAAQLQRLALVAEHTQALVVLNGADQRIQWVNHAFEQATGWQLAEARGGRAPDLLRHPLDDGSAFAGMIDALRRGEGGRAEILHRRRDGSDLWLDLHVHAVRAADGRMQGTVAVATDITTRVQQQGKVQALWAVLPVGVCVLSREGRFVEANRAAEQLLGLTHDEMLSGAVPEGWQMLHEDGRTRPLAERPAARVLASGRGQRNQTVGLRLPDGTLRWLLADTEPLFDTQGQISGVVMCVTDITERRALQQRLSDSARTDALTRLPNRAVVMERLSAAIDHARRHPGYGFAVLFMDFDRFKQVNDTLGHAAGDELLRRIAERLQRALRPGDALARLAEETQMAARLGGDEFVVVLEGVAEVDTASVIAQRLLHELAEPYTVDSNPVHSTASIGLVVCRAPAPGLVAEDVLRNADTAMYEAKRAGRGRVVMFDDSMHERVVRALALENELRRALQDDELFVVYQPVVALPGHALAGVEALVRWAHPQRGVVPPLEFIPVAEECGLIDAVGHVVLRKACAQFMQWRQALGAAAPRWLAVNLSRAQLDRHAIVGEVRAVLAETGMPPELLQLEVTESLAAQDERVQATLRELKGLGVLLALDDFGTGYSSLACLHQLPVDTVKIDRSFVKHAETVEYHRVLIEATIRVARTLGMSTVAEGIETAGQAALMRALDCDRGQGFLFSRPLEADALADWARARAAPTRPAELAPA